MRLLNIEIDDRVKVKLDKSIKVDDLNGIMKFGENNDYPYIIEKLINGSITAKASANTYSKFLVGNGFAPEINSIIIGKKERHEPRFLVKFSYHSKTIPYGGPCHEKNITVPCF